MRQWREVLRWFVRDATGAQIARETRLERKRVMRALLIVRQAILDDERADRPRASVHRASRSALIGLRIVNGVAAAEVVPAAEAEHIERWLAKRARGHAAALRNPRRYMAVVSRGRLHRVVDAGERLPFGPVEAFWAHLQRQLRSRGGIRRERLDLYLSAFAWRYNRRKLPPAQQVDELLALIARRR